MDYSFFALIALCVTALALVAMLLIFCYKQDKTVAFKNKAKLTEKGISSELILDIDTENGKDKKEINQ